MENTGIEIPRGGGEIRIGDVLTSKMTHDVVVMWHKERKEYIVKVTDTSTDPDPDVYFNLEQFVTSWGASLNISHNINEY